MLLRFSRAGLAALCFGPLAAQAALPDLMVESVSITGLTGDWQALTVAGTVDAVLANAGGGTASSFTVTLFEDVNGTNALEVGVDNVLGQTNVTGLPSGQRVTASVAIATTVRFRQDLVLAMADDGGAVAESDETNNVGNSGATCTFQPTPGNLNPTLEWSWTASNVEPTSLNVLMNPAVIDLDGDQYPEVVFVSTPSQSWPANISGHLRALDGRTGAELFTVTDARYPVAATNTLAAGDLDQDGRPEILGVAYPILNPGTTQEGQLICFEHDGTFKWLSPVLERVASGSPSIVDLDGDGSPEIVIGRQALDANGNLLWTGAGGTGTPTGPGFDIHGPLSVVADIDLDGSPDVVAGNTAYDAAGALKWQSAAGDGWDAIGNFDSDQEAEIVISGNGRLWLLEHDGTIKWGPVTMPGADTRSGPPTIADFDADGQAEIGVATAVRYSVYEGDGTVKWTVVTQDWSSSMTGSSVFDFEGDGQAEVVYRDEKFLRIYRGTDGAVLWQIAMSSGTWLEYVLVADVDLDGNAEIVATANNNLGAGPQQGVFVFGAADDSWAATRSIWNQHAYHITNVNDDGTIPAREAPSWLYPALKPFNCYRQNLPLDRPATAAPDVTASYLRFGQCTGSGPDVTARIGNAGSNLVGAGLPVSFYSDDPNLGGTLLGTVTTAQFLRPGEYEDVTLTNASGLRFDQPVFVVADDAGGLNSTQSECDETNNQHSALACITAAASVNYGQGWAGTLGVPSLALSSAPILGTTVQLEIGNSFGVATPACLLKGSSKAVLPTAYGGSILLVSDLEIGLMLAPGINRLNLTIPCDPLFCGAVCYLQVVEYDPGASLLVSFSAGLDVTLGG